MPTNVVQDMENIEQFLSRKNANILAAAKANYFRTIESRAQSVL